MIPALFARSSILFVAVNVLRLLSVVAILLALSGEIIIIVDNIKGFHAYQAETARSPSPSAVTTTSASRTSIARSTATSVPIGVSERDHIVSSAVVSSATTTAASAMTTGDANQPALYVPQTDIPKQAGGVLFATLSRIFNCFLLLLALLSEIPPPTRYVEVFWDNIFPPFGERFGVGILGTIQVGLSCSILSHAVRSLPLISGWFIFIIGVLNMLFGLALRSRLRPMRSIFSFTSPNRNESKLPPSNTYDIEFGGSRFGVPRTNASSQTKKKGKGIQISAPFVMQPPPVYGTAQ